MFNCPACRSGECVNCPDRTFLLLGKEPVCTCKRTDHNDKIAGEPRIQQVEDPFTGDIHGPGLIIDAESGTLKSKAIPNPGHPTDG
jgi:hypothetical protein